MKAKGIITLVTLSVLQSQQHRLCLDVELTTQSQLHVEIVLFAVTCYTNYDTSQYQVSKQAQAVHQLTCQPSERIPSLHALSAMLSVPPALCTNLNSQTASGNDVEQHLQMRGATASLSASTIP